MAIEPGSVLLTNGTGNGLSSGEGLIWQVRDPIEQQQPVRDKGRVVDDEKVTTDPGVSDNRLLVIEEEFVRVLASMGRERNTLSAVLRQAWDSGDMRTMTKSSPARATGAHVSIVSHVKYYLQVTDAHFAEATQNQTLSAAEMSETDGKPVIRPLRENEKGPEFPGLSRPFALVNKWKIPPTGGEQAPDFEGNLRGLNVRGKNSGARREISDLRLIRLIDAWLVLSDDTKGEILRLAGCDVGDLDDVAALAGKAVS